jgi:hypothetical protein
MNELHLQNPAFRNCILDVKHFIELNEIIVRISFPVYVFAPKGRREGERTIKLFTHDRIFDKNMVWNSYPSKHDYRSWDDLDDLLSQEPSQIRTLNRDRIRELMYE